MAAAHKEVAESSFLHLYAEAVRSMVHYSTYESIFIVSNVVFFSL
jgi:hypothetical protein